MMKLHDVKMKKKILILGASSQWKCQNIYAVRFSVLLGIGTIAYYCPHSSRWLHTRPDDQFDNQYLQR